MRRDLRAYGKTVQYNIVQVWTLLLFMSKLGDRFGLAGNVPVSNCVSCEPGPKHMSVTLISMSQLPLKNCPGFQLDLNNSS